MQLHVFRYSHVISINEFSYKYGRLMYFLVSRIQQINFALHFFEDLVIKFQLVSMIFTENSQIFEP